MVHGYVSLTRSRRRSPVDDKGIENFLEGHLMTIKGEGKIYSACGDAKIPFIASSDIAAVAFHALTDEKAHDKVYLVMGPEALTYDEVFCLAGCAFPCDYIR
jgi:uncharacterized protein YbjT (DUF2867 family)